VLDDFTPLRHAGRETLAAEAQLIPPATAYRVNANQNRDTPLPLDEPRTPNPPAGAVIDYILPAAPRDPIMIEIFDSAGKIVRRFGSDENPVRPAARQYFADDWLQPLAPLPARAGHNRFVWNLRTVRPTVPDYDFSIAAVPGVDTPVLPQGIFVPPGKYEVRLTVGGRVSRQTLTVEMDPRVNVAPADLAAQRDFYDALAQALQGNTWALKQIQAIAGRLKTLDTELAGNAALRETAKRLAADIDRFQADTAEENLDAIAGVLTAQITDVEGCDCAPTAPQREVFDKYKTRLDAALAKWQTLADGPIADLDRQVRAAGLAPVVP
jgi:hypothetical protein